MKSECVLRSEVTLCGWRDVKIQELVGYSHWILRPINSSGSPEDKTIQQLAN